MGEISKAASGGEPAVFVAPAYVVDADGDLPERWRDWCGPLRVMTRRPVEGYVMVRRPGSMPFVLRLGVLLNTDRDHNHGPFERLEPVRRRRTRP